jgi:hypothetical protein
MLIDDLTISSALEDLAATTQDKPLRLAAVEDRARRMRRGRIAGRASIVVICVTALGTGIGLAGSGDPKPSELTAIGMPPVVLPLCSAIRAQPMPAPPAKGSINDDAKRAAARAAAVPPSVGETFKAPGTITGTPAVDKVTILVAAPLNPTSQPVTFAITRETQYFEGNQPSARQTLHAGAKVGFVGTRTGQASYRLDEIDTDPARAAGVSPGRPTVAANPVPAGLGATGNVGLPAIGQAVEGKGFLTAVPGSHMAAISFAVAGGALAGSTVRFTVTPETRFLSSDRQCDPSGLAPGVPAAFAATRTGTATYRLDQLNLG